MYSVEPVSDNLRFLSLEDEWNDAVERAGVAHPFLRHEWIRAWLDAFADSSTQRLHTLVVRQHGRIRAIAPLMYEDAHMYGVRVRRLRLLHNDHTPRTDMIAVNPHDDLYRAIWRALHDDAPRWDVLQLSQLPEDSPTRSAFTRFASEEGQSTGFWHGSDAPYVTLGVTWQRYLERLTSKFRQNLRNRSSRLSKIGEPALEVVADPSAIRASRDAAEMLEASGWKADEGTAIGSDHQVQHFYRLLIERARECPWLRLLFLKVGGKRIAVSYAAMYADRLFLLKTGYDPEYAKCSPFKLLTSLAIQHACDNGLRELDFLGDAEPWKLEWTSTTRPHDWLFVFAGTPRGRLLHPLKFQIVPALRQLCTSQPSRA